MARSTNWTIAVMFSIFLFSIPVRTIGQVSTTKFNGGSVQMKIGFGFALNAGSSLERTMYVINDAACPLNITAAGIQVVYLDNKYRFKSKGSVIPAGSDPIVAYELVHVLYNVFGEKIKSLSEVSITDIEGNEFLNEEGTWYATENQASEFLTAVTFVSFVRTKSGKIWKYNSTVIMEELGKIQLSTEDDLMPKRTE